MALGLFGVSAYVCRYFGRTTMEVRGQYGWNWLDEDGEWIMSADYD